MTIETRNSLMYKKKLKNWPKDTNWGLQNLWTFSMLPQRRDSFRIGIQKNFLFLILATIHIIADKRRLQICDWNVRLSDERSHISERVVIRVVITFHVIFHRTREGDVTNEQQADLLWKKRKRSNLLLKFPNINLSSGLTSYTTSLKLN